MKKLFYLISLIIFFTSCENKFSITLKEEITKANTRLLKENNSLHTKIKNFAIQEPEQYNVIIESINSYDSIQNTSFKNKKELFLNLDSIKKKFSKSLFIKNSINETLKNINEAYLSNFKDEIITHELLKLRNNFLLRISIQTHCGSTINNISCELKNNSLHFFSNGHDSIYFNRNIKNINVYTSNGTPIELEKTSNENTYWKIITETSNSKKLQLSAKLIVLTLFLN